MIGPEDLRKERYTTGQIGKLVGKNYHTIALHKNKGMINMVQDPVSGFWYADKKDLIDYLKKLGLWDNSEKKRLCCTLGGCLNRKKGATIFFD